jgi:hypothetical protein
MFQQNKQIFLFMGRWFDIPRRDGFALIYRNARCRDCADTASDGLSPGYSPEELLNLISEEF